MKLLTSYFGPIVVFFALGNLSAIAQAPSSAGELERLRHENQQLRQQLSAIQKKSRTEKAVAKPENATVDKKVVSEVATVSESRSPSTFLDRMFLRKSVFDQ